MSHICPRPCSRLATAAVFISVGVVQFVVGIILLRSEFVFLLAGPDFWTSCCNIAVGCLLGVSASIWKQSKKRQTTKHVIRRNLLSALLFSALIINSTTLGILILGEGNTVLSIRLESGGGYNSHTTFVSEVLAYAYATSVCCPIVCIVITIVSLAGNCFTSTANKSLLDLKTVPNSVKRDGSDSFNWVYTPEILAKERAREVVLTSSSESSSNEEEENVPMRPRYVDSVEDLQRVLYRMALGKRDSIMSDSTIMLRQMDQRRKNKFNSLVRDGSYLGPVLSHAKESALSERNLPTNDLINYDRSPYGRSSNSNCHSLIPDESSYLPSEGTLQKHINQLKNKSSDTYRKSNSSNEVIGDYHNASAQLAAKNFIPRYGHQEKKQTKAEIDNIAMKYNSDFFKQDIKDMVGVHKKLPKRPKLEIDNLSREENLASKRKREAVMYNETLEKDNLENRDTATMVVSADVTDISPDGSECGADSFDLSRSRSWAGEVVPISVNATVGRLSQKLIPVPSPVVPGHEMEISERSDSADSKTESTLGSGTDANEKTPKSRKSNLSSFREDVKPKIKENMTEYPKVGSQSVKKYDLAKVVTMTSISEEPNAEVTSSSSGASRDVSFQDEATTPKSRRNYLSRKSLSSAYCESKDRSSPGTNKIPKRKVSASCKTLKKMWSVASSENKIDILDQVVDQDSLIGLSEEELIARQLRNRSLRKTIQQRIKQKAIA